MLALLFHTGRFFAAAAAVQHCNIALFTWSIPGALFEWRELSKTSPEDPLSECCGSKECLLAGGSAVAVLAECLFGCSLLRLMVLFWHRAAFETSLQIPRRRRRRRRCSLLAPLLYCLTAGQVATFVLALWQNDWQIEALARNPLVGPSEAALRSLGSLSTADIIDQRQYWRLITSIFMCSGEFPEHAAVIPCAESDYLAQCV